MGIMKSRFFIFIHLLSIGCVCEAVKSRRKKNTSHKYRDKYFLSHEGQSCDDISDKRKKKRTVQFCSVPAPEPDVSTTLTFWGWQKREGKKKKYVQVYGSSEATSNETFLFEMKIRNPRPTSYGVISDDSRSEWYHQEFILNSSIANEVNISYLKLYYSVKGGKNEELNLRDVWIRPTDKYSKNKPPRSCNLGLQKTAIVFAWLGISVGILAKLCDCTEDSTRPIILMFMVVGILSIYLLDFVSPYPTGKRCKNDEEFIAIVVLGSIFLLPYALFCCCVIYVLMKRENTTRNQRVSRLRNGASRRPQRIEMHRTLQGARLSGDGGGGTTTLNNEENVIKIATQNVKENKFSNREVFHENENECSICMDTYTMVRPGVVTECGHVWCSKCISDICKMRPPNHSGICPTCRSPVQLKNLILLSSKRHMEDEDNHVKFQEIC